MAPATSSREGMRRGAQLLLRASPVGWFISLVYVLAAVALWRLWSSEHTILWWCILGSAVLSFWTAATIRNAYRQAIAEAGPRDEVEGFLAAQAAKYDDVVRFWTKANILLTGATLVLSVIGLVSHETRRAEPPESVALFFESVDDFVGVPQRIKERLSSLDPSQPEESITQLRQALIDAKSLIQDGLDNARRIDRNTLNSILPDWGDRYHDELVRAMELLNRAIADPDSVVMELARASDRHGMRWDRWYEENFPRIVEALADKYNVEVR